MNEAVVKSYARSIRRGTRSLDQVPEALREAVAAALTAEKSEEGSG